IRVRRDAEGLSLRAFGAMVGVSYPYLSRVENGEAAASVDVLLRIADGLGVPVGDLFSFEARGVTEYSSERV
ncbi:MAG: helix-turn-helix transcriptional regulator, partial [Atopobiaceae bacterium]|nr:helix-turn-helix transcriptional regulator [Atopobiaceae bacterium]MBQ9006006.1 helix-turn-helix transcriptional regulator [Atopobiaceae bacterium]